MSESTSYMKLYIGDYFGDTQHLKGAAEHGAYLLLIMHAWKNGGELPPDDARLRSIAKMTGKQWSCSKEVLLSFFQLKEGVYRHKRIDEELQLAVAYTEQRKQAGKASARHRMLHRSITSQDSEESLKPQSEAILTSQCEVSSLGAQVIDIATKQVNGRSIPVERALGYSEPESESESYISSLDSEAARAPAPTHAYTREETDRGKWRNHPANGYGPRRITDAAIVPEQSTGKLCVQGFYLEDTFNDVLDIAGMDPAKCKADWKPVIEWLKAGIEPSQIYKTITHMAEKQDYTPPATLQRFDKPVRDGWGRRA